LVAFAIENAEMIILSNLSAGIM
jgi:hypothetical protein